jgi:hypothetical protein
LDKNSIACESKYDVGDIVEYSKNNYLVTNIVKGTISGPYNCYHMMRLGTSIVHTWFTIDVDFNSRLVA